MKIKRYSIYTYNRARANVFAEEVLILYPNFDPAGVLRVLNSNHPFEFVTSVIDDNLDQQKQCDAIVAIAKSLRMTIDELTPMMPIADPPSASDSPVESQSPPSDPPQSP